MISTGIIRFIGRILNRMRSDEGWLTVFAVLASVIIVAGSLEEARWLRSLPSLYICAVLAVSAGMIAARLVRTGWLGAVLLVGSGLLYGVLTAARAWPSFLLITSNLRYAFLSVTDSSQPLPVIVSLPAWMIERFSQFSEGIGIWQQEVVAGEVGSASQIIPLLLLWIVWTISGWAGWATFRYRRPLLALLPAGFVLAANTFFSSGQVIWLVPFMVSFVVLALRLRQYSLEKNWETNVIDYSPEFHLDFYLSGLFLAAAVAMVMVLMPNLRLTAVSRTFWGVFDQPYDVLEAQVERFLPDLDRTPRGLVDRGVVSSGGLPRSHIIGNPPELSERVAMTVSTSDLNPYGSGAVANYRWRGVTFSEYNGRGWANPDDLDIERVVPGEVWQAQALRSRRTVRQRFEVAAGHTFWLYGIAEPIASDRAFQAHLRGPNDAVGFEANAADYTIISQAPNVTESDLRAVSPTLDNIPASYLALPASLPVRVIALANKVTVTAVTPYDKARAIESFLRTYPYDLDVPEPPPGTDISDYFLFDLQRGYCDYYATSMVVMARSLGLPARLAVGYAAGKYDEERQRFTVFEVDAHSWPELYFSDYGWIPFEPTASQPVFVHQPLVIETEVVEQQTVELATQLARLRQQSWLLYGAWRWAALLAILILLPLAFRFVWQDRQLRRQAANSWQLAYLRLEEWGDRLDVPPAPWLTPREYAQLWRSSLSGGGYTSASAVVDDIIRLSEELEQHAYAPSIAKPDDKAAKPLWRRLRSKLWRLRWERRFRKEENIKN